MKKVLSLLLCTALAVGLFSGCGAAKQTASPTPDTKDFALAQATYPKMTPYPQESAYYNEATGEFDEEAYAKLYNAWLEDQPEITSLSDQQADALQSFFVSANGQFLTGSNEENHIYSPLNVYLALGMLAQLTAGDSRAQILDVLGAANLEALTSQVTTLWNNNYYDDGAVTSILASSLWLNQNITFQQDTLDTLANVYHASSYQGQMGSPELNQALQAWLNAQTGNLLADQAANVELNIQTVLALATTIYFRAKWQETFSAENTKAQTFHSPTGDLTCDFMHQSSSQDYYWSDQFSAVSLSLASSGKMWLFLPDEGVTTDQLLTDAHVPQLIYHSNQWKTFKNGTVDLAMPKFDVVSDLDLSDGLKALGITDVFDADRSDFSPMTADSESVCLSQAAHAARVTVDEEGCIATAYTVMGMEKACAMEDKPVAFVLDRPFMFVITGKDNSVLFAGVVNRPVS